MSYKLNLVFFIKHEILFQVASVASLYFLALPQKVPKNSRIFNASSHKANARPLNIQASAQIGRFLKCKHDIIGSVLCLQYI